jgi:hypothetical protein
MRSSGQWMTLGGAVMGAGVLIWVTWLILRPTGQDFWSWIGIAGVAVTVGGAAALIFGFVKHDEHEDKPPSPDRQSLRSGSHSTNLQAGRDIKLGGDRAGD